MIPINSLYFAVIPCLVMVLASSGVPQVNADPLTRIADDVLSQTVYQLPIAKGDPQPSRYNLWMYQNFMIMEGMRALGEATGNPAYKTYADRNIDFFAAYQAKYGDKMTAGPAGLRKWYSRPKEMWQCGMIAAFAERSQTRPDPEFERGMRLFDALLAKAPKIEDGVLVRNKKRLGLGLQIDDLYMVAPYWARKAELTQDPNWLDRAIDESLHYFDYLWDDKDKLMKCLWLNKTKTPYGLYWGRGNGWYVMAITDLLAFVPQNHPKREDLLADYRRFIDGIIRRQGENGLWHQILDDPTSYTETSCSGMFTYCVLEGVNNGWLDATSLEAGQKGWHGLLTKVNKDFELTDVCPPTDISTNPDYYKKERGPRLHDQHGIGPFLLAGAAYRKASAQQKRNR